jgi:hypothetical protein
MQYLSMQILLQQWNAALQHPIQVLFARLDV